MILRWKMVVMMVITLIDTVLAAAYLKIEAWTAIVFTRPNMGKQFESKFRFSHYSVLGHYLMVESK